MTQFNTVQTFDCTIVYVLMVFTLIACKNSNNAPDFTDFIAMGEYSTGFSQKAPCKKGPFPSHMPISSTQIQTILSWRSNFRSWKYNVMDNLCLEDGGMISGGLFHRDLLEWLGSIAISPLAT